MTGKATDQSARAQQADHDFRSYMAKVPAAVQGKLLDKSNVAR